MPCLSRRASSTSARVLSRTAWFVTKYAFEYPRSVPTIFATSERTFGRQSSFALKAKAQRSCEAPLSTPTYQASASWFATGYVSESTLLSPAARGTRLGQEVGAYLPARTTDVRSARNRFPVPCS